jgi:hypothetical protein
VDARVFDGFMVGMSIATGSNVFGKWILSESPKYIACKLQSNVHFNDCFSCN